MYKTQNTNQADKDVGVCIRAGYGKKLADILDTVKNDPYAPSQGFERLVGNLKGAYSRQINHGNRFIYKVLPNTENARDEDGNPYEGIVRVFRAWEHNYKPPRPKK
jgi:Txe/YoeB family toxin of toxin-antitoxin system